MDKTNDLRVNRQSEVRPAPIDTGRAKPNVEVYRAPQCTAIRSSVKHSSSRRVRTAAMLDIPSARLRALAPPLPDIVRDYGESLRRIYGAEVMLRMLVDEPR